MAKSDSRGDSGSVGDIGLLSNDFIVQDRKSNNDAAVIISQDRKDAIPMWNCVAVLLKAKIVTQKRKKNPNSSRQTVCIGLAGGSQEKCDEESILMNDMIRKNLGVELGDVVSILSFPDVKQGLIINVTTLEEKETNPDKANLRRENLLNYLLKPYFMERARPVHVGDEIRVRRVIKGSMEPEMVRFKVTESNPSPYCFVVPQTIINLDNGIQMMNQMQASPFNTLENQLRLAFAQQRQGASGDNGDGSVPSIADQAPTAARHCETTSNHSNAGDEDDWDVPSTAAQAPTVVSQYRHATNNSDLEDDEDWAARSATDQARSGRSVTDPAQSAVPLRPTSPSSIDSGDTDEWDAVPEDEQRSLEDCWAESPSQLSDSDSSVNTTKGYGSPVPCTGNEPWSLPDWRDLIATFNKADSETTNTRGNDGFRGNLNHERGNSNFRGSRGGGGDSGGSKLNSSWPSNSGKNDDDDDEWESIRLPNKITSVEPDVDWGSISKSNNCVRGRGGGGRPGRGNNRNESRDNDYQRGRGRAGDCGDGHRGGGDSFRPRRDGRGGGDRFGGGGRGGRGGNNSGNSRSDNSNNKSVWRGGNSGGGYRGSDGGGRGGGNRFGDGGRGGRGGYTFDNNRGSYNNNNKSSFSGGNRSAVSNLAPENEDWESEPKARTAQASTDVSR